MSERSVRGRPEEDRAPLRLVLCGAAPDTGNLGVSALCWSVVAGVFDREPGALVTVCDHGRGMRDDVLRHRARDFAFRRCGVWNSRRLHRRESLWNMRLSAALGGLGNPGVRAFREADAVLDITGGDSFTDLYGPHRFRAGAQEKRLALGLGTPLVLLPQTYGPFREESSRREAAEIARGASMAWARDTASFEILRGLLGGATDPARHGCGVDVAFDLPELEPSGDALASVGALLAPGRTREVVGFNVSGLIRNDPAAAAARYGLTADYAAAVREFLLQLLAESDAHVLLVPHVVVPPGHFESDVTACRAVAAEIEARFPGRVSVAPEFADPREIKWIIARTDWFCGTRMHSTIASLSSGVPTAAIAYSAKTRGVFETCGAGDEVADPRTSGTRDVVDLLIASFRRRSACRQSLRARLPSVLATARDQMDRIVAHCRNARGRGA